MWMSVLMVSGGNPWARAALTTSTSQWTPGVAQIHNHAPLRGSPYLRAYPVLPVEDGLRVAVKGVGNDVPRPHEV